MKISRTRSDSREFHTPGESAEAAPEEQAPGFLQSQAAEKLGRWQSRMKELFAQVKVEAKEDKTLKFTADGGLTWTSKKVAEEDEIYSFHDQERFRLFYYGTEIEVKADTKAATLRGDSHAFEVRKFDDNPNYLLFTLKEEGSEELDVSIRNDDILQIIYDGYFIECDLVHAPTGTLLKRDALAGHYKHLNGACIHMKI